MAETDPLDEIAGSISDGSRVDWKSVDVERMTPGQRKRIGELRVIDAVCRFHRAEDPGSSVPNEASSDEPDGLGGADRANRPTIPSDETRHGARTATADRVAATKTWDRLELRESIGSGGFGRVYRAWDPTLQREVALKLVDLSRIREGKSEAYLREGRLQARVSHPNMVRVHGANIVDGRAGIWMELVEGRTLEAIVSEQGTFGANEAAAIGVEVCRALAAVHGAGLIHRDIKTANIMRERGGRVVLMDLGAGFDAATEAARAGETTGTPYFMAPEVLRGESATVRSDLYGLGVVLFRLVSGGFPVKGRTLRDLVSAHAAGRVRSLRDLRPDLPSEFVRVVERALSVDPAERYASAGAFQAALEALMVPAGDPQSGEAVAGRSRPKRLWFWPSVVVVALALVVPGLVVWRLSFGPAGFTVEAGLYRVTETGRLRIRDGDRLNPEDKLSMQFKASAPAHVYVINRDEQGETYMLFPVAGFDLANPLEPNVTHRLPGSLDGTPKTWQVTTRGGSEHFLIVASQTPLAELERELAALPQPSGEAGPRYAKLSDESVKRLRGVGGLADDPAPRSGDDLFARIERLGLENERATGVWMRRLTLTNP